MSQLEELDKLISSAVSKEFKPIVNYNKDGQYVEVIWCDCSYYADRTNDSITLYKKQHTDIAGNKDDVIGIAISFIEVNNKEVSVDKLISCFKES